jgi:hypothetical protein
LWGFSVVRRPVGKPSKCHNLTEFCR